MKNYLGAGFVQFDIKRGAFEENLSLVEKGLELQKKTGSELVVLPEMWSCGFDYPNLVDHGRKYEETVDRIGSLSKKYSIVITGSIPEYEDGNVYNTMTVLDKDGSLKGEYRKIHLFSYGGETNGFKRGESPVVCETSLGELGLMTCYDLRFPELARTLTYKGAEIIVVSAQWPEPRTGHYEILLQARAIENQLFVIGCNRVGISGSNVYIGHSMVVSPKGKVLAMGGDSFESSSVLLEMNEMDEYRKTIPALEERVPEAYEL